MVQEQNLVTDNKFTSFFAKGRYFRKFGYVKTQNIF